MLDPKRLRTDLDATAAALARRGFRLDVEALNALESRRKRAQIATQDLQNQRNARSKSIGQARARGEDIEPLRAEVATLNDRLKEAENTLRDVRARLHRVLLET